MRYYDTSAGHRVGEKDQLELVGVAAGWSLIKHSPTCSSRAATWVYKEFGWRRQRPNVCRPELHFLLLTHLFSLVCCKSLVSAQEAFSAGCGETRSAPPWTFCTRCFSHDVRLQRGGSRRPKNDSQVFFFRVWISKWQGFVKARRRVLCKHVTSVPPHVSSSFEFAL